MGRFRGTNVDLELALQNEYICVYIYMYINIYISVDACMRMLHTCVDNLPEKDRANTHVLARA